MTEKITAADAIRLLDSGKAVAVDVREPDEYAVGHIPGAKLLPLGQVTDRAAEVLPDKNALWLVYCRTGRRSADAVQKLEALGITCRLALRKLLLLYNYFCSVNLLSFTVGVASGLNTSGSHNSQSLTEILLCKFSGASKGNTVDKICSSLTITAESAIYSQCISGNCQCILTCGISHLRISGQASH